MLQSPLGTSPAGFAIVIVFLKKHVEFCLKTSKLETFLPCDVLYYYVTLFRI